MLLYFSVICGCIHGVSFHRNRTTLSTDPCTDPFWTSFDSSCRNTFESVGKCNWDVWNCDVTPQSHGPITASCRTSNELCAFQFAASDDGPLHCTGSCLALSTMLITIVLALGGFLVLTFTTVAVVCCCCVEGAPCKRKLHSQRQMPNGAEPPDGSETAVPYGPARFPSEMDADISESQTKPKPSDEPSSDLAFDTDGGQAVGENPYASV
jgi:hypothetical protein